MQSERTSVRYPHTWEANLLVALVSILALAGGAVVVASGLPVSIIIIQAAIILPALLWIAIRRLPTRTTLRLNPTDWRVGMWSALIGLACWPVVAGASALIDQGLSLIGPGPEIPYPTGTVGRVIYAITLIILAPLTEEPVFRGFVLSAWLRRGTALGLLITSLLFGSFHFSLAGLVPLTFLGLALGLLAHRSNSIYAAMIAHACYNTIGTLFLIVPALREISTTPLVIAGVIALPAALLLLWNFSRRFNAAVEDNVGRETSSWIWTVLSSLVVVLITGLVTVGELILRLSPQLTSP